jgi:hypothetical protein
MKHVPVALAFAGGADARWSRNHGSTRTHGDGQITRCSDWHVEFDDRDATVAEENLTIRTAEASPLVASPSENGGITVIGSDGADFEIAACKAAPDDDAGLLGRVHLVRHGGTISVEGPDNGEWTAQLIIRAPKSSSVQIETHNGPVSLSRFQGKASVRSENGPVSLVASAGDIDVETTNGPISVDGGSGRIRVHAQNGPLSVNLQNTTWSGGELEGRTQNGPVHLDLAADYSSGVLVESAGRSPFHCSGSPCRNARRNWDDRSKSIAFGAEHAVVRLSTENGPVSIGAD